MAKVVSRPALGLIIGRRRTCLIGGCTDFGLSKRTKFISNGSTLAPVPVIFTTQIISFV